jgi:hypothetical protein
LTSIKIFGGGCELGRLKIRMSATEGVARDKCLGLVQVHRAALNAALSRKKVSLSGCRIRFRPRWAAALANDHVG